VASRRWPNPELPTRYEPELATLVKEPPTGDEWLHEIKFDGYRFGCRIDKGVVKLLTRRGNDWTAKLPHIARAAPRMKAKQALLDGEVAVVLPNGKTSFHGLQEAFSNTEIKIQPVFFAFDLLFIDGKDLTKSRLEDRKAELRSALAGLPPDGLVKYSDHVLGNGPAFFENAKKLGLEGIVSKRRASAYHAGRSTDWLKVKAVHRQEFVVCGYILRDGSSNSVGSFVLAVRSAPGAKGHWVYSGQVGTGFTHEQARKLYDELQALRARAHPFREEPKLDTHRWSRRATPATPCWVHPERVCEVAFTEWTPEGTLRHPSFQGMREDKDAKEVVREG
jgi:bifunctional non-homologous end joining protein LigD